jgi:hypothetical protein
MSDERSDERKEREHYLEGELEEERREENELEKTLEEVRRREQRTEEELEREKHRPHPFVLVFIINGEDFPTTCSPEEILRKTVERALAESGNSGRREVSEWEVRNEEGVLLEMAREVEKLGLQEGARLFLSLKVAAGG